MTPELARKRGISNRELKVRVGRGYHDIVLDPGISNRELKERNPADYPRLRYSKNCISNRELKASETRSDG